jgi:hypothetical protein
MRAPSLALVATAVLQIALGGVLSLGFGPVPALGMVGVALGHILATAAGVLYFLWYLIRSQGRLTLHLQGFVLQRTLLADILRVGAVACLSPVQSVLAILILAVTARAHIINGDKKESPKFNIKKAGTIDAIKQWIKANPAGATPTQKAANIKALIKSGVIASGAGELDDIYCWPPPPRC